MSTQVSVVNRNPTFSPYAVDSPPDSIPTAFSRGHDNRGYENYPEHKTDPSSHTYAELPGLQNGNSRRRVANPIYDSADSYTGHSTKHEEEPVQPYKESKLGCVLLFVILLISIAALVLVVMIILGKLGPACSCENTGSPSTSQLKETQSNVNLDKITEALNSLKKNLSEVETKLNKKIADLKNELNDAKNQIQTLQRDNDNAELWRQSNETRDKLNVHEKTHDTKYEQMMKTINDTVDKCRDTCSNRNLTQRLQTLENEQQNDVNRLQKNINDSNDKCMTVNNTLTVKINEVSKMEGPMGPRGYNGSQGIQGPKGDKGDTGAKGDKGDKGDTGGKGDTGNKGDKGDTGDKGDKGDKGDTGATGAVGPQGPSGAGNLTQCVIKVVQSTGTSSADSASQVARVVVEPGKKILHYSCTSESADIVLRQERFNNENKKEYSCRCTGKGNYVSVPATMHCYLTYTECPLIS